jgi:predicted Zn-dependent protease
MIEIDPQNFAAYNNLAWNLAELGNLDQASEVGRQAMDKSGTNGGVIDTVGWIEFRRGKMKEAVELLERASRVAPNTPDIRFHYAQALEKQNEIARAVAELEAIMLATPGFDKIEEVRAMLARLAPDSYALRGAADAVTTGSTPVNATTSATAAM